MDNRVLNGWLNKEDISKKKRKVLLKAWDVIKFWGAFDGGYWKAREIARELQVTAKAVHYQVSQFKANFPEVHQTAKENRFRAYRVSKRQYEAIRRPLSWDQLREEQGDSVDSWIVEKF